MKKLKFLIITCLSIASLVFVSFLILVQSSGQAAPIGAIVDSTFDDEFNVELTESEMGFVGFDQEFTAIVTPLTTTIPITYTWTATEQNPITHTSGLRDSASFSWSTSGTKTITVTATNPIIVESASVQMFINPLEVEYHLPIILNTCFLGTDQILYEDDFDLFVINSNGTCLTKLSDPATAQDWSPSWSPDGTQIAFLTSEGVPCCTPTMHLMDADGSNETDTPGFGGQPVWSPDGTKIAFSYGNAQPYPSSSIYFFQLSGGNAVLLAGGGNGPVWSPDGSKILFTSFGSNDRKINLMNADGSNRIELATDEAYSPSWSPDGTRIAYLVYNEAEMAYDIYLMQPNGLNQTKLTGHVASAQRPAWSPDGLQIAFTSNMDGNNEVYVIDVDGTGLTNLTNHPSTDNFLNWSPDGSEILFESSRFTPFQFAIMFADGSSPRGLGVHGDSATWRPSP